MENGFFFISFFSTFKVPTMIGYDEAVQDLNGQHNIKLASLLRSSLPENGRRKSNFVTTGY